MKPSDIEISDFFGRAAQQALPLVRELLSDSLAQSTLYGLPRSVAASIIEDQAAALGSTDESFQNACAALYEYPLDRKKQSKLSDLIVARAAQAVAVVAPKVIADAQMPPVPDDLDLSGAVDIWLGTKDAGTFNTNLIGALDGIHASFCSARLERIFDRHNVAPDKRSALADTIAETLYSHFIVDPFYRARVAELISMEPTLVFCRLWLKLKAAYTVKHLAAVAVQVIAEESEAEQQPQATAVDFEAFRSEENTTQPPTSTPIGTKVGRTPKATKQKRTPKRKKANR